MKLGTAIKSLRVKRGLKQTELAQQVGISETSICLIENDKTWPHKANLAKICTALEISEPLLLILSIDEGDVHEDKKSTYRILFPVLRTLVKQLIKD